MIEHILQNLFKLIPILEFCWNTTWARQEERSCHYKRYFINIPWFVLLIIIYPPELSLFRGCGRCVKVVLKTRWRTISVYVEGREKKFPLSLMWVLAPGSLHAWPFAQPPIDTSGNLINFLAKSGNSKQPMRRLAFEVISQSETKSAQSRKPKEKREIRR